MTSFITRFLDRIEQHGLAQQTFTAFFPLAAGSASEDRALGKLLRHTDAVSPFDGVPGVHSVRWALVENLRPRSEASGSEAPASGPLILDLVHDGDAEDVLYELVAAARNHLDTILRHCHDYHPAADSMDDRVRYILRHRHRSSYLFRDRRHSYHAPPLLKALRPASHSADTVAARMATSAEIRRAMSLRKRFVDFAIRAQGLDDRALRVALDALRAQHRDTHPIPMSRPFEQRIESEGEWVRRAAELARNKVRRDHREQPDAARRAVHGKHHGLLEATFEVYRDMPVDLMQGVFVPGAKYPALVRASNADARPRADRGFDGRGLAIKLLVGDRGQSLLPDPLPDGPREMHLGPTQDFVLVSHPTFFIKDARDYTIFRSIVDTRRTSKLQKLRFATLWLLLKAMVFALRRPREVYIFVRTLMRRINHPLRITYHSALAFLHGEGLAVKYSVYPVDESGRELADDVESDRRSENYLSEALQQSLDRKSGKAQYLEFAVHVPSGGHALSAEDPRRKWREPMARRVPLARIVIHPQEVATAERMELAERLVFTPWHGLAAHKPLGSLNRARLLTYVASAAARSALNGVEMGGAPPRPNRHSLVRSLGGAAAEEVAEAEEAAPGEASEPRQDDGKGRAGTA